MHNYVLADHEQLCSTKWASVPSDTLSI